MSVGGGVQLGAEACMGGGQQAVFAFENFARRLVHSFPAHAVSRVSLALMLRRRAPQPVPQARRRQLEALLVGAMAEGGLHDCASGWRAAAELQYENREYSAAHDTALRGLKWLQNR